MEDNVRSMMYQYDDEEPVVEKPIEIDPQNFRRSRKVRVGVVEYELPSLEYVHRLEQIIDKQARMLAKQQQDIDALKRSMIGTRNFIRRQTNRIAEINEDLEHKLDTREM